MKYLYPYECEKRRLSTPQELQAAIDGNRREGRRSSYGQYDSVQRSPNPSQISPLSLVSQQQQIAARMNSVMTGGISLHNGAHHPSHPQPMGQPLNGGPMAGLAPNEFETRMIEYMKLLNKEMRTTTTPPTLLYNNNQSPLEHQKEALNLSEPSLKREPDCNESPPPKKFVKEEEEVPKQLIPNSTHIKINSRGIDFILLYFFYIFYIHFLLLL